jgi:recombination protein RecT
VTTQTVSKAVVIKQKEDQVITWLRNQQDDIAMAAASHVKPSAIIRVTQGALRRNDKLMAAAVANPQSLLYCLLDAARLGHEPDTDDYYLVPFGNEVTGIEGYKGIIERMFRAGGVTSVVAQVRRERDHYVRGGENVPPVHEYDDMADPETRGPLKGAYAYALLTSGQCSQVIAMGAAEIAKHKAKSRGSDKPDSPWQQWTEAMWKKTVLRALEPYVQTSTEYRQPSPGAAPQPAVIHRIENGPGVPSNAAEPVYDAEIVDDQGPPGADAGPEATAPAATAQQVNDQFKRLGFGPRDVKKVLAVAATLADRKLISGALAEFTPAQLAEVHARLKGCGTQDDLGELLGKIAESRGPGPDGEAAAERAFQAGDADG